MALDLKRQGFLLIVAALIATYQVNKTSMQLANLDDSANKQFAQVSGTILTRLRQEFPTHSYYTLFSSPTDSKRSKIDFSLGNLNRKMLVMRSDTEDTNPMLLAEVYVDVAAQTKVKESNRRNSYPHKNHKKKTISIEIKAIGER